MAPGGRTSPGEAHHLEVVGGALVKPIGTTGVFMAMQKIEFHPLADISRYSVGRTSLSLWPTFASTGCTRRLSFTRTRSSTVETAIELASRLASIRRSP